MQNRQKTSHESLRHSWYIVLPTKAANICCSTLQYQYDDDDQLSASHWFCLHLYVSQPEIAQVIAPYSATGAEQLTLAPGQLILIRKKNPGGWWEGELQVHSHIPT